MLWLTKRKLNSDNQSKRAAAVRELRSKRALQPMIEALRSPFVDVRAQVAIALGEMRAVEATGPILALMELDIDSKVRQAASGALFALGWISTATDVNRLISLLKNGDETCRRSAAEQLGNLRDSKAVLPLLREVVTARLRHESVFESTVCEILTRIGEPAVSPLIAVIKQNSGITVGANSMLDVEAAAIVLGKIGDRSAVEPLLDLLRSRTSNSAPKCAAIRSLAQIGDFRAAELIASFLGGDRLLQDEAMKALDLLGWKPTDDKQRAEIALCKRDWDELRVLGRASVDVLISEFWKGNAEKAAEILGDIGDPTALAALFRILREAKNSPSWSRAAMALSRIGSQDAVPELIKGLDSSAPEIRKSAAEALGMLGNPTSLKPLFICAFKPVSESSGNYDAAMRTTYVTAIHRILERGAQSVCLEDLRTLVSVTDPVEVHYKCNEGCEVVYEHSRQPVDCSLLRQLARQELLRRHEQA